MGIELLEHRLNEMQLQMDDLAAISSNLPVSNYDAESPSFFMIKGQATSLVAAADETFQIDGIEVFGEWGNDPRQDPLNDAEKLTIANDGLDLNDNDEVHAIYAHRIHSKTNWQVFIPGATAVITGVSAGGTASSWDESTTSMVTGCIEVYPFIIPELYDMLLSYSSGDRVRVPIPEWKGSTAYATGAKVKITIDDFNPAGSYTILDQVVYNGKLYQAIGTVEPGDPEAFNPSEWTQTDACYEPTIYKANDDIPDSQTTFNSLQWDATCDEVQMYEADTSVDAIPEFDSEETYDADENVSFLGQRYSADDAISAGIFDTDEWTAEDNFDEADWTLKSGTKYINKSADCTVRWRHGMVVTPLDGHYVEGMRGELIWYDCNKIPGYGA